ncbi:GumC family protein [Geminicoccus harenae]|uniref:GumC family protein n=3 Tax=Geminicoccus harenae TaxID=2498453 RepID=UPI0021042E42|nr:polysaccharide biosynthesis tyrosine autokinase [Geminicoccus harenae]
MADDQYRYPPQNQVAYRPADYEGEADGPNLGQLAATLWRRKAMIIGIVVLGTGLAGLAGLSMTKKYTAKAMVVVQGQSSNVVNMEQVAAGLEANPTTVETQIRVLQSAPVIDRVMTRLNLFDDEEFRPSVEEGEEGQVLVFTLPEPWSGYLATAASFVPNSWLIATGLAKEPVVASELIQMATLDQEAPLPTAGAGDGLSAAPGDAAPGAVPDAGMPALSAEAPVEPAGALPDVQAVPMATADPAMAGEPPAPVVDPLTSGPYGEQFSTALAADPYRQVARDKFLRNLTVSPEGRSFVIGVSFTSESPDKAARVANLLAESYVQSQIDQKRLTTDQAGDWLGQRVEELRKELEQIEAQVQQYQIDHNLTSGDRTDLTDLQLTNMNQQLLAAQAQQAGREARLQFVRELKAKGQPLDTLPEVLASPLVLQLRAQESDLERQEGELRATFGAKHPRVQLIATEKEKLRHSVNGEIERIIANMENEAQVNAAQIAVLQEQLGQAQGKSGEGMVAEVGLRELEREAQSTKQLYESFLQRYKETREQQQILDSDAKLLSAAQRPVQPSTPGLPIFLAVGFVASSLLGSMGALLLERMDKGLRSAEDVERYLGLLRVGLIPQTKEITAKRPAWRFLKDKPLSVFAESVRGVGTAIRFADVDNPPRVILVTSSVPGEGKSTLAQSLAVISAAADHRVLVIDLDTRRPVQAKNFGVEPANGVVEFLGGEVSFEDAVVQHPGSGVDLLLVRRRPTNPAALLESKKLRTFIEEARSTYDYVILDTPPVLGVNDALLLCPVADTVVFVTQWAETKHQLAHNAVQALRGARAKLLGAVLTKVDVKKHKRYGYGDAGEYYGTYTKYYSE